MSTYARRRTSRPSGPRMMDLRYPGTCDACDGHVPAGERAQWSPAERSVTCLGCLPFDPKWVGSPISGRFTEPPPTAMDTHGPSQARPQRRARYTPSGYRCTHEDYPCCGC